MLIPFWDYALIEPIKQTETESWILLEEEKTYIVKGRVIQIPEQKQYELELWTVESKYNPKVGDIIYFWQYSPDIIVQDWQEYRLVKYDTIICKEA